VRWRTKGKVETRSDRMLCQIKTLILLLCSFAKYQLLPSCSCIHSRFSPPSSDLPFLFLPIPYIVFFLLSSISISSVYSYNGNQSNSGQNYSRHAAARKSLSAMQVRFSLHPFPARLILTVRKRKMASLLLPHTIPFSISTPDSGVMALSQRANNV
jgi:hypothetical protein